MDLTKIALVNYQGGGHGYIGPWTEAENADYVKSLGDDFAQDKTIERIYVLPYDIDKFPSGNADQAGEFEMWTRPQTPPPVPKRASLGKKIGIRPARRRRVGM